jgi:hypothetical protein
MLTAWLWVAGFGVTLGWMRLVVAEWVGGEVREDGRALLPGAAGWQTQAIAGRAMGMKQEDLSRIYRGNWPIE